MKEVAIRNMVSSMKDTMSSLEIAKLTGKRHDHVLRDIEKFLLDIGEGVPKFGGTYVNEQNGVTYPCFNLPKRECIGLASGYDAKLRMAIIDRWAELEYNNPKLPQTFAQALMLAGKLEEEKEQALLLIESQRKELEVAEPVLELHKHLINEKSNIRISVFAKILSDDGYTIGAVQLLAFMRNIGLVMKQGREPIQKAINDGYMAVDMELVKNKWIDRPVITPKGCAYIISKLPKQQTNIDML